MKKTIKIMLLLFFSSIGCTAQETQENDDGLRVSEVVSCEFKEYSFHLEYEQGIYHLNDIIKRLEIFKRKGALKNYYIGLTVSYCREEQEKDPYIGMKRAKEVLDYLVANSTFPRNQFVIQDKPQKGEKCSGRWVSVIPVPGYEP
ncbi:MAG: hypothetical protein R3D00_21960 [Bacteroidia bacterium]